MNARSPARKTPKKNPPIFVILTIATIGVAIVTWYIYPKATSIDTSTQAAEVEGPRFAFDASKAPGWSAGANVYSAADPATAMMASKDSIPVVSMKIIPTPAAGVSEDCFVTYSYLDGGVPEDFIKKREADRTMGTNLIMNIMSVQSVTMDTNEGLKAYDVHQYSLDGASSENLLRGIELGYFALKAGYVEVRSYCSTAAELTRTLDALRAVTLH